MTAIDLRRRLELGDRASGKLPLNAIVRTREETVSLLVDEIGDVLEVGGEKLETPRETLRGKVRQLIRGAYKLKDRLLLLLDVEKVVDLAEVSAWQGKL